MELNGRQCTYKVTLFMDPSVECCVKYSVEIELMCEKICVSEYIRVKSEHGGDSVEYSVELQPSVWSITCAFKCAV